MILMQTVPTHLKIQEMQDRLIDQIPGVVGVHEFHIWQLAGSKIIGECNHKNKSQTDAGLVCFVLNLSITGPYFHPRFFNPS